VGIAGIGCPETVAIQKGMREHAAGKGVLIAAPFTE
jgi:hypothetical protein